MILLNTIGQLVSIIYRPKDCEIHGQKLQTLDLDA